jgi:hypothetical protein
MRAMRILVGGLALAVVLFGAFEITVSTVRADPPVSDPNCSHPCQPTKKHNGFTCTFAGCTADGTCTYAC